MQGPGTHLAEKQPHLTALRATCAPMSALQLTDNKAGAWGALKPAMHPSAEMYPPAKQ